MTYYAVLEQSSLSGSPLTALASRRHAKHECIYAAQFSNSDEFSSALMACVSALVSREEALPKLLVISAHGVPLTGTDLQASDEETINLWEFDDYFAALPPTIVVLLSSCFGAYPSAGAIQQRSQLVVLGPLVDIMPEHVNQFQSDILEALQAGLSCRKLALVVHRHNKALANKYSNRYAFGIHGLKGSFFPARAQGSQLANEVLGPMTFKVTSLITSAHGGGVVRCRLESDDLCSYDAGIAPLLRKIDDPKRLVGMRFRCRYQVLESHQDGTKSICLLSAKKR